MDSKMCDFIYLLSCFLNGEKPEDRAYDWEGIYKLADVNDVPAMLNHEISLLKPEYRPYGTTLEYYKKQMALAISSFQERLDAYNYAASLLEKNGVDFIAVKGIVVSDYYPVPEYRTSGDFDLIVSDKDIEKVNEIFKSDSNISVRTFNAGTIISEVLDYPCEIHDSADVKNKYFENIFDMKREGRHELLRYDHLLYVLCHLIKHLSYRGAGIRMLTDVDVMIRNIVDFDEGYFYSLCREAGVQKSAKLLLSLSAKWFKTPLKDITELDEDITDKLARVLVNGGSFGDELSAIPANYMRNQPLSRGELTFAGKLRVAFKMAFPGKTHLKKLYRYYEKHTVLYPVAVLNRLADAVFSKRGISRKALSQLHSGSASSALQLEVLDELDIKIDEPSDI